MKVEKHCCDYCTRDTEKHSTLRFPLRPDMDRDDVCADCQDRIAEFIQGSLLNRTQLRELARQGKSLLA